MPDPDTILATDVHGNDITIAQVQGWLNKKDKQQLATFFHNRFYGKYLKPHDFPDPTYKKEYKNGFAVMTSCCLLIETFVSFTEPVFRDTNGKSERCFGYFFVRYKAFSAFAANGLPLAQYLDLTQKLSKQGTPNDFYSNIRCGLLHNGETRNGWKISRSGDLFDQATKRINAVKFMDNLNDVIKEFQQSLVASDYDNDPIWKTYRDRLTDLITNS